MAQVIDLVRLEMRMCADKNRYSARLARLMAEQLRARGVPVGAYRCLFHPPAEAPHWHVGHCPSMRGVQEMADAIRPASRERTGTAARGGGVVSRTAFVDPVRGVEVVLVVTDGSAWDSIKVEHPGCSALADVSCDLDDFYCPVCRWNGRVSGAWAFDQWAAFAPSAGATDGGGS